MSRLYPTLCLIALLLAGCATSVTDANQRITHDVGVLQWAIVGAGDIPTLDPALASDPTSLSVASLVYGGLVRLDGRLRVRPDGATRWTISRQGTVYTFFLRPNLRFSDGRPVTAQDFAAALERALGPEGSAGSASFYLSLIAHPTQNARRSVRRALGIEAVNPTTLRITLAHPAAHFLAELAFPVSFVPDARIMARYGTDWTDHAAGFGPYVVRVWRHTRFVELDRNPYYYGGLPGFRRIVIHFYGMRSALQAYRDGRIDLISGLDAGTGFEATVPGVRRVPGLAQDYLAFNTTRMPFHRVNARYAFASVWSPKLAAAAMDTAAFPARGFLPSAFGVRSPRWTPIFSGKTYLKLARFPRSGSFPSVTLIMQRDPHVFALARVLQRAWKSRLGIDVGLRQLNLSNYGKVLADRAFDLAIVRWGGDYADPQDFLGTQLGPSSNNVTGWSRTAYNGEVSLADSYAPTDPRRSVLFQLAATYGAQKVPILPLDEPAISAVIRPELHGVQLTPLGTISGSWTAARLHG